MTPPLKLWRNSNFWKWFILLLIPIQIILAIPGAFLIDEFTGDLKAGLMLGSQQLIGWLLPFALARRIVLMKSRQPHGFEVVLKSDPQLEEAQSATPADSLQS